MNYIEIKFTCSPNNEIVRDILSANLADIGFESFAETDNGLAAYIQENLYDASALGSIIKEFPLEGNISYSSLVIEVRNWNEEWEKNYFKPLVIDDKCIIKSTFHEDERAFPYTILIDPKMSFGTGHHQTTELMIREILDSDFTGKPLLDMGCGTAILAILASMRGANPVYAIDIDEWAYENAKENLALNHISNVDVQIGGAELLESKLAVFEVILANINRNILLKDIRFYAYALRQGGALYMSGFYTEDISAIEEECAKHQLLIAHSRSKDNWAVVKFVKQ